MRRSVLAWQRYGNILFRSLVQEPICSALAKPEMTETSSVRALIHADKSAAQVPSTAIRGGRRAQGGGGEPKMRPWRRINHQLQLTRNVDPGVAGSI